MSATVSVGKDSGDSGLGHAARALHGTETRALTTEAHPHDFGAVRHRVSWSWMASFVRRWIRDFVPAPATPDRANIQYAGVSVGQRQLTKSLLTRSAAADRLRMAGAGARSRHSRRARDRQRPHVPRVRTRRDAQADPKAHRARP